MGQKGSHGVGILEVRDQRWRKSENQSASKVWYAMAAIRVEEAMCYSNNVGSL